MQTPLRRGLPRIAGGEPWPPAEAVVDLDVPETPAPETPAPAQPEPADGLSAVAVRRGLPRTTGGEAYPPVSETYIALPAAALREPEPAPEPASEPAPAAEATQQPAPVKPVAPKPATASADTPAPSRNWARWLSPAIAFGFALALAVLLARYIAGTDAGGQFIQRFDGRQPLPAGTPVGIPAWLNWAHFFNMLLMVLIIKTGLSVRSERKPEAYWAPKNNPRAKISLTLWLHLALDIAWVSLGAVFYVLLFSTGQWARIVPTSWDTFPNALSAGLQYLTLNWPEENGWVYYNALQELTYFAVVFIAAPLAIISGARMSPWWPKSWSFVSMKAARSIHFPTMIFFVVFIITHVGLVLLTGMRRNLNAMFAARGDVDPATYATDWTGTLVFLGALAVIAAAWFAARPLVVAPVARLTGTVSQR
ncbi:cytochrome b/b6 domain-containing protein [Corynebacterium sanguinis]|uniref:cytochrome b/b6 domain-containing protein n=1 Tax=Corynebacterium sanguinis TaxID=2594913 RepID=UPI0021AFC4AC|nr:cytochrome b/b6 domain-containing protein [Corynebacterium sanguinis]MCT1804750.1 cytochrome b/b6 domain-containing protein [Corynebacterium sanguinis]MCT2157868.1 cytochrome b/b6 domain-containing protein [Corynebacterium sanguinis]